MKQRDRALEGMRYFDQVLADNEFVAGDEYSMADITVFAGLAFADFANIEVPTECTHLKAWHQRMGQRPALAA